MIVNVSDCSNMHFLRVVGRVDCSIYNLVCQCCPCHCSFQRASEIVELWPCVQPTVRFSPYVKPFLLVLVLWRQQLQLPLDLWLFVHDVELLLGSIFDVPEAVVLTRPPFSSSICFVWMCSQIVRIQLNDDAVRSGYLDDVF